MLSVDALCADSVVVAVLSETKALSVRVWTGAVGSWLNRAGGCGSRCVGTGTLCGGAVEERGEEYVSSGGAQCR